MNRILKILFVFTLILTPLIALAHGEEIFDIILYIGIYLLVGSLLLGIFEYKVISHRFNKIKLHSPSFIGFNYAIIISTTFIILSIMPITIEFLSGWFGGFLLITLLIFLQIWLKNRIYKKMFNDTTLLNEYKIFLLKFLVTEVIIVNISIIIIIYNLSYL